MNNFKEELINSISDIISRLIKISTEDSMLNEKKVYWFRGQSDHRWPLVPKIYRTHLEEGENLEQKQKDILIQFINRKRHLLHKYLTGPQMIPDNTRYYHWLSILQHYGYNTSLLDFSEKLIPSLLFALRKSNLRGWSKNRPCVWLLKPLKLNQKDAQKTRKYFDDYNEDFIPTMDQIKLERDFLKDRWALLSPYNTERIKDQSGSFVAFPVELQEGNKEKGLIETLALDRHENAKNYLEKWILNNPDRISKEINLLGYNYGDMFIELDAFV